VPNACRGNDNTKSSDVNMQTLLTQPVEQPKWMFRRVLSAVAAFGALAVWVYSALVFPAASTRKHLQLTGNCLCIVSAVAAVRRRPRPSSR